MTKRLVKLHQICRQIGLNLWRDNKSIIEKPGQHSKLKTVDLDKVYSISVKNILNNKVLFKKYYINCSNKHYKKLLNLFGLDYLKYLETRLDTLLYRSGFTKSLFESRYLINHAFVKVNNNIVSSTSYLIKVGDLIQINYQCRNLINLNIKHNINYGLSIPSYLEIDNNCTSLILVNLPKASNIPFEAISIIE